MSIKRVLTEIELEDLEIPSTDDLSVPEKPRRKTSKVSKEENTEESKSDSVDNDDAGDVTEDPSTKVPEVDKNDTEGTESPKDVAEQDVQGIEYFPLKYYFLCTLNIELPICYSTILNILLKSKFILSCVDVPGLSSSFESPVALLSTPMANLSLCGWILSTTGNFTCSIKGQSNVLSHNRYCRLWPLMTALCLFYNQFLFYKVHVQYNSR